MMRPPPDPGSRVQSFFLAGTAPALTVMTKDFRFAQGFEQRFVLTTCGAKRRLNPTMRIGAIPPFAPQLGRLLAASISSSRMASGSLDENVLPGLQRVHTYPACESWRVAITTVSI